MEQEKGLLEGVVVLDLTRVLAGPYCGALMADMGATVIKVEQPGKGDDSRSMGPFVNDQSVYYANFNRSKMGVTLNLKDPEAKEIFKEMVKKADVVIENYRPGTMEKLGLGTKSTRHSIIERLYAVKYIVNDPIEPSQLGMAVCDALDKFAPHITHPEMTAELEEEMDNIAEGRTTRVKVVDTSRDLLADQLASLLPHSEEVKDALADAVAADAYVGPCPKCGKDLQLRASQKTRGMFIGCAGWPDCDVTYPLPKGKVEAVEEKCPVCGMPQVKVTAFRSKPRTVCIDPNCATNKEPDVVVGECPACKAKGKEAKLIAQKNPRTLKRFIHCENYDECGTGYPLPQYGRLEATGEVCEHCGAPLVVVTTNRGPWKLCPNFDCPGKEQEEKEKASAKGARKAPTRRTGTRRKASAKK